MKFRIVTDAFAGFEFQVKRWWWPIWHMPYCNTFSTVEKAEEAARKWFFNGNAVKQFTITNDKQEGSEE